MREIWFCASVRARLGFMLEFEIRSRFELQQRRAALLQRQRAHEYKDAPTNGVNFNFNVNFNVKRKF